jgi:RimJ/RimL family protein N-acetyltransferase
VAAPDRHPAGPPALTRPGEKEIRAVGQPDKNFHFALRLNDSAAAAPAADPPAPGRLIGFARLQWVDWMHRVAPVFLGIGAPADRGQGYGQEALDLILRYGFDELGLHRVEAKFGGYNTGAARFFERNGFQLEVRRRQAVARDGQRWDMLQYALLQREWAARRPAAATEAA